LPQPGASCGRKGWWALSTVVLSLSNVAYAGPGVWTTGGPYGGYVIALAVDPTSPATVYAGTRAGIFRSHDSGRTWAAASAGLTNLDVTALAVGTRDARSTRHALRRDIWRRDLQVHRLRQHLDSRQHGPDL
jgi:hypothetical protein